MCVGWYEKRDFIRTKMKTEGGRPHVVVAVVAVLTVVADLLLVMPRHRRPSRRRPGIVVSAAAELKLIETELRGRRRREKD